LDSYLIPAATKAYKPHRQLRRRLRNLLPPEGCGGKANIQREDACAETRLRIVTTNLDEEGLKAAGVEFIVSLPHRVVRVLTGLKANRYAAEMRGRLTR
jgi:phosphotransferase system IIB component